MTPRAEWRHPHERTGVRFVLANPTDLSQADDYRAWYDEFATAMTLDPASAWSATENSPYYPTRLLADPRTKLVAPVLQGYHATTGSIETDDDHAALTGYCASRFRTIDGTPDPPAWLEVFETSGQDPLRAYAEACDAVPPHPPADGVRQRISRSFALVAAHDRGPLAS